jgi:hypothetical protein
LDWDCVISIVGVCTIYASDSVLSVQGCTQPNPIKICHPEHQPTMQLFIVLDQHKHTHTDISPHTKLSNHLNLDIWITIGHTSLSIPIIELKHHIELLKAHIIVICSQLGIRSALNKPHSPPTNGGMTVSTTPFSSTPGNKSST